jgi:hypothetical protein
VQEISFKDGALQIHGQRLFLFYDADSKIRDIGTLRKDDKAAKYFHKNTRKLIDWYAKAARTDVILVFRVAEPEIADITRCMDAVFVTEGEPISSVLHGLLETLDEADGLNPQTRLPSRQALRRNLFA